MARSSLVNAMLSSALMVGLVLLVEAKSVDIRVSECPEDGPRNETTQIPHETDCTKFYMCFGKTKIERECPFMDDKKNRLHFNPEIQQCDWPWDAGCDLSLTKPETMKDTLFEKKAIPKGCPRFDSNDTTVFLADDQDCTKFFACFQGQKIPMACPTDQNGNRLYFNPEKQVCDWPFNVDCQMPQLSMEKKDSLGCDAPTHCPRVDPIDRTVHIADNYDCTKFFKCLQGTPLHMSCPPYHDGQALFFNRCEQVCDWRYNVDDCQ